MTPVTLSWLAQCLCAALGAGVCAAVLGMVSRLFFVVGLLPLITGLAAGGGALLGSLVTRGGAGAGTPWASALAVLCAWLLFQGFDDHHFQRVWAEDLAASRAAASGVVSETSTPGDEVAFFAPDAEERLAVQVRRETGFDGPLARWWLRAHQGVRLLGPWDAGRGVAVGPWGALTWAALEMALGAWVARRVIARAGPQGP